MAADTQNIWDKTEKHSLKFGDDIKKTYLCHHRKIIFCSIKLLAMLSPAFS